MHNVRMYILIPYKCITFCGPIMDLQVFDSETFIKVVYISGSVSSKIMNGEPLFFDTNKCSSY